MLQTYIYTNRLFIFLFMPCQRRKPCNCNSCSLSCFLVPLTRITGSDIARYFAAILFLVFYAASFRKKQLSAVRAAVCVYPNHSSPPSCLSWMLPIIINRMYFSITPKGISSHFPFSLMGLKVNAPRFSDHSTAKVELSYLSISPSYISLPFLSMQPVNWQTGQRQTYK